MVNQINSLRKKTIEISSYQEFLSHIPYPRSGDWLYRGIRDDFPLVPSLYYEDLRDKISDFTSYEKCVLERFLAELSKKGCDDLAIEDWETWFLARHFQIKSRLSDFSINDTIAFQFAMEMSGDRKAMIYCLHRSAIENVTQLQLTRGKFSPFTFNRLIKVQPSIQYSELYDRRLGVRRVMVQSGKFIYQPLSTIHIPLDEQISDDYWVRFLVDSSVFANLKKEIRETTGYAMDYPLHVEDHHFDNTSNTINTRCCNC